MRAVVVGHRLVPDMAGLGQQIICGHGAPGAGGVEFAVGEGLVRPTRPNRIHKSPGRFNLVAPNEQGRIAGHGLEQEPLIGLRGISAKLGVVTELHAHGPDGDADAWNLAVEPEGDAFIGLKTKGQGVGVQPLAALRGEEDVRGGAELDAHFADAGGQAFAGPQEEGDARPAPGVNKQLERNVGLRVGIRFDIGLLAVARVQPAIGNAGEILPPHDLFGDVLGP